MGEVIVEPGAGDRGADDGMLGWRARRRPHPAFAHLLGAVAGGFVVVAMVAFVAAIADDDPQVAGTILGLVVIVAALAGGAVGPGPVRTAAVTAVVLTVPLLWLFALVGDGDAGRGEVRGVLLLTLVSYAALYVLNWTKGRTVLLAGALVVLTAWVTFEVAGDGGSLGLVPDGLGVAGDAGNFGGDPDTSAFGALLVLGIAWLLVGALLDRRRYDGAATPFIAVGMVSAIFGGVSLTATETESQVAAGLVAVAIGAAVGLVGAAGRDRRATSWLGVLTVFFGLSAVLEDIAPSNEWGVGAIALAFAVGLGAVAWLLAPVLQEPDDGLGRGPGGSGAPEPVEPPPPTPTDEPASVATDGATPTDEPASGRAV